MWRKVVKITQVAREFLSRLVEEESIFHPRLVDDSYGLAFFTAVKEFDHYYYNMVRHDVSDTALPIRTLRTRIGFNFTMLSSDLG